MGAGAPVRGRDGCDTEALRVLESGAALLPRVAAEGGAAGAVLPGVRAAGSCVSARCCPGLEPQRDGDRGGVPGSASPSSTGVPGGVTASAAAAFTARACDVAGGGAAGRARSGACLPPVAADPGVGRCFGGCWAVTCGGAPAGQRGSGGCSAARLPWSAPASVPVRYTALRLRWMYGSMTIWLGRSVTPAGADRHRRSGTITRCSRMR